VFEGDGRMKIARMKIEEVFFKTLPARVKCGRTAKILDKCLQILFFFKKITHFFHADILILRKSICYFV